jgi:hypothetical protein
MYICCRPRSKELIKFTKEYIEIGFGQLGMMGKIEWE